jgi:phosphoglycerol transferase MdoB-like AlkP superfamily enzyme
MKGKIKELFNDYLLIILAFLPGVFLIRLGEFLSLNFLHAVPENTWFMELCGYLLDNFALLGFSLFLAIPVLLILLWHRKTGMILFFISLFIYTLLSYSLSKYFTTTLVPLDQVIFYYSPKEIIRITLSSTRFDFPSLISLLVILSSPFITGYFLRNRKLSNYLIILFMVIILSSPLLYTLIEPDQDNYQNDYEYFVKASKPPYLVKKIISYKSGKNDETQNDHSFPATVDRFHSDNPQFSYSNRNFPLMRVDATPDVLGDYFRFSKVKPNLVFIIVESLSTSFCGDRPYYGSYMPFLDSLIDQGLYWKNFLSTAERTFNVLPAVFGSLPYSEGVFYKTSNPPYHFSLIRYLKENGYAANFFYGGDPSFSGYDNFMFHQGIDHIVSHFNKSYGNDLIREGLFEWGYPDGDLFKRSFEVIDSLNRSPRLDIYLTLSTHAPFIPPDQAKYQNMLDDRLKKMKLPAHIKRMVLLQRNIFSTVMYTDEALRKFFDTYRKRADFDNTIFIITGDHAMPELNITYLNLLEKYHVPLIIYSPMLKKPGKFKSVSSHLDIAPSVLAMLKGQGLISVSPIGHWLGKGIDVSVDFRNTHSLSFVYNNGLQGDFINGNYFISFNRLYRLLGDLKIYPVKDALQQKRMKQEQEDFLRITDDIAKRKEIVPLKDYLAGNYHEIPYLSTKPNEFKNFSTNDVYISLVPPHRIGINLQFLYMDLSIHMETKSKDSLNMPTVVCHVLGENFSNVLWVQYHLQPDTGVAGKGRMILKKYLDIEQIKGIKWKNLKIYLYNPEKQPLLLDKMHLELKGYQKNK